MLGETYMIQIMKLYKHLSLLEPKSLKTCWNEAKFFHQHASLPQQEVSCALDGREAADMTSLGIFLWGCVKSAMYGSNGQVPNLDHLQQEISQEASKVMCMMLACNLPHSCTQAT
jgi:hypothetical protein